MSELVNDTLKRHTIQQFPTPELEKEGGSWILSICQAIDENATVYTVQTPPLTNETIKAKTKKLINQHLEDHQKELYQQLIEQGKVNEYEKSRKEKMKRIQLWIEGTVKDRGLYGQNLL
ncbi:unnamed protein product [Rhizopus stolonifer]